MRTSSRSNSLYQNYVAVNLYTSYNSKPYKNFNINTPVEDKVTNEKYGVTQYEGFVMENLNVDLTFTYPILFLQETRDLSVVTIVLRVYVSICPLTQFLPYSKRRINLIGVRSLGYTYKTLKGDFMGTDLMSHLILSVSSQSVIVPMWRSTFGYLNKTTSSDLHILLLR